MKILGRRVLVKWEVFNWHDYMGCSYIRIASPINQQLMKIPSVPSAVEETHGTLNTLSLSFSLLSESRNWFISRHWWLLVSSTFLTHNSFTGSRGGCCPEIVTSQVCSTVVTVRDSQWEGLGASRHQCHQHSACSSIIWTELDGSANPYAFASFHILIDHLIRKDSLKNISPQNNVLCILSFPFQVMDR